MPAFNPLAAFQEEFNKSPGGQGQVNVSELLADPNLETKMSIEAKPPKIPAQDGQQGQNGQTQAGGGGLVSNVLGAIGTGAKKTVGAVGDAIEFLAQPGVTNLIGQTAVAAGGPDSLGGRLGQSVSQTSSSRQIQNIIEAEKAGESPSKVDLLGLSPQQVESARASVRADRQEARQEKVTEAQISQGQQRINLQEQGLDLRKSLGEQRLNLQAGIALMDDKTRRDLAAMQSKGFRPLLVDKGGEFEMMAFDLDSGKAQSLQTFNKTASPEDILRAGAGAGAGQRPQKITSGDLKFQVDRIKATNVFNEIMKNRGPGFFGGLFQGQEDAKNLESRVAQELFTSGITPEFFESITGRAPNQQELEEIRAINQTAQIASRVPGQFGVGGAQQRQPDQFGYVTGEVRVGAGGNSYRYTGNNQWQPVNNQNNF